MHNTTYSRIAIVGCSGSGKSTLAKNIAAVTSLPVTHLDGLFWLPDWVQRDAVDFKKLHDAVIAQDRWIIEGNNNSTMPERFDRADLIIVFDYPRWLSFFRLIRRLIRHYNQNRDDMGQGCHERFDWDFWVYVWNFHKTTRVQIENHLQDRTTEKKILRTPKDAEDLLKSLSVTVQSEDIKHVS